MFDPQLIQSLTFVRCTECHEALPSTNDRALRLAADDQSLTPSLVLAESQSAGRGRGANRWWSSSGALTFSLLLDLPTTSLRRQQRLSLLAALRIRESLAEFVPSLRLQVKWPNDVYLSGKKVCGLLVESTSLHPHRLVMGVGINVNNSFADAPAPLSQIATSLIEQRSQTTDPNEVLISVLKHLEQAIATLDQASFKLSAAWQPHCLLTGRSVLLEAGKSQVVGVCQGIDDDGAILLRTPTRLEHCPSGTISAFDTGRTE